MKVEINFNFGFGLSGEEFNQLVSEIRGLEAVEIPHNKRLETMLKDPKLKVRKISATKRQGEFYYRIDDYAYKDERLVSIGREGYSSSDLKSRFPDYEWNSQAREKGLSA